MFRTPLIAALTVALLSGTALAQPANSPPANLPNSARSAPDYDDDASGPHRLRLPDARAGTDQAIRRSQQGRRRAIRMVPAGTCAVRAAGAGRPRHVLPPRRRGAHRLCHAGPGRQSMNRPTARSAARWAARRLAPSSAAPPAMPALGAAIGAGAGLIAGTAVGADNARQRPAMSSGLCRRLLCLHGMKTGSRPVTVRRLPAMAIGLSAAAALLLRLRLSLSLLSLPYYYGPGVSFGFGFGGGWHGWLAPPLTRARRSDGFDCSGRAVWSGRFLLPDRRCRTKAQSRQAQSAAAAHPDPAAGDRPHSRARPAPTPDGDVAITQFPHAHGDHFHLGDATVRASDATGLENQAVWNALAAKA